MKKSGDSCNNLKQIFTICFMAVIVICAGVNFIASSNNTHRIIENKVGYKTYEVKSLDIPIKIVNESGDVVASSTGFAISDVFTTPSGDVLLGNTTKNAVDSFFNGALIKEMAEKSMLDENQKEIINSLFDEESSQEFTKVAAVEEDEITEKPVEENIVIAFETNQEAIDVKDVVEEQKPAEEQVALPAGQESVWLYEESQVPDNYITYYDMTATAYCLCKKCTGKTPGSSGYGRTASGLVIKPGTSTKVCAVCRSQIPLGTHIYVQGLNGAKDYGYAIAADTGGGITYNRIDLYFDNHSTCLKWGRRSVRVYVLPDEE